MSSSRCRCWGGSGCVIDRLTRRGFMVEGIVVTSGVHVGVRVVFRVVNERQKEREIEIR